MHIHWQIWCWYTVANKKYNCVPWTWICCSWKNPDIALIEMRASKPVGACRISKPGPQAATALSVTPARISGGLGVTLWRSVTPSVATGPNERQREHPTPRIIGIVTPIVLVMRYIYYPIVRIYCILQLTDEFLQFNERQFRTFMCEYSCIIF